MSYDASTTDGIEALFSACDIDGSGFIDQAELALVCSDLSPQELSDVFRQLDSDGDGQISIAEFTAGFQAMRTTGPAREKLDRRRLSLVDGGGLPGLGPTATSTPSKREGVGRGGRGSDGGSGGGGRRERRKSLFDIVGNLDQVFSTLSCQEQLCELYQQLYDAGQTDSLSRFEDVMVSIMKDVRQQQSENERLERSYKREKEEHARHLRHLEEEMETQMQKVEGRVRKEERSKFEAEKEEIKNSNEVELFELQENIKRLQQTTVPAKSDRPVDEYRVRLDESAQENRLLRRQLTDAQTTLAILKGEAANSRSEYEDKCYELETEKRALLEYAKEHENLSRQIQLLHEANKKLHDTNDDLREALGTARVTQKRPPGRLRPRKASVMSTYGRKAVLRSVSSGSRSEYVRKYLQDSALTTSEPGQDKTNQEASADDDGEGGGRGGGGGLGGVEEEALDEPTSLADELSAIEGGRYNSRRLLPAHDSCEVENITEDIDSGHFTIRDVHDDDYYVDDDEYDDEEDVHPVKRSRQTTRGSFRTTQMAGAESFEEGDDQMDAGGGGGVRTQPPTRSCSFCSHSSREGSEAAAKQRGHQIAVPQMIQKPITQEPERVFKIVLAGDAAVGKSSFIMRLCKNKFITNLNSTLGVDFQTKTLDVDGHVISLQLWDTAGQERFRSIARSYFRRADGVLLLYDVTYERSFISVRDWLEAIEEGAQKQIPIMLVGNKSDLRPQLVESSRTMVKMEEGQRLARDFNGLFIETSAKDGRNILEAVTELSRMLMASEDLEVQTIGLKLQDSTIDGTKKKSPCCNI